MKLLLWAILGVLCWMAGPLGWLFFWGCVAIALGWGLLGVFWALLGAFFTATGRAIGRFDR